MRTEIKGIKIGKKSICLDGQNIKTTVYCDDKSYFIVIKSKRIDIIKTSAKDKYKIKDV